MLLYFRVCEHVYNKLLSNVCTCNNNNLHAHAAVTLCMSAILKTDRRNVHV